MFQKYRKSSRDENSYSVDDYSAVFASYSECYCCWYYRAIIFVSYFFRFPCFNWALGVAGNWVYSWGSAIFLICGDSLRPEVLRCLSTCWEFMHTIIVTNDDAPFHLWWKTNLIKYKKFQNIKAFTVDKKP